MVNNSGIHYSAEVNSVLI